MLIGFTYDLRTDYLAAGYGEEETAEFDQVGTIDAIDSALCELGHATDRIGNARALVKRLAAGDRWDLVFNICEGLRGMAREAQVPSILDVFDIPYTFADPAVLALCLDKALTKTVLRAAGLPTPDWQAVRQITDLEEFDLSFPVIAKPVAEGTGKGIDATSKIVARQKLEETCERLLHRYEQPVLVERFLPGREFTVGILNTGRHAVAVGTLEIVLRAAAEPGVYSYSNKENSEKLVDCVFRDADGDERVAEAEAIALAAWRVLGGRDAGRADLRCDEEGRPQLMEINPLAGLHPTHSDLPMLWTATGGEFVELIRRIIDSASLRKQGAASRQQRENFAHSPHHAPCSMLPA
jgi:D-alanine-D-alanine ligase